MVQVVGGGGIKGRGSSLGAGDFRRWVLKGGVCLERRVMFGPMKRMGDTLHGREEARNRMSKGPRSGGGCRQAGCQSGSNKKKMTLKLGNGGVRNTQVIDKAAGGLGSSGLWVWR